PVIDPPHGTEYHNHAKRDPDITVFQIRPQQRGENDRNQDQGTAHGRRAGFRQVALRAVITNRLANLVLAQLADHDRADKESDKQRRQHAENGAQRNVLHDQETLVVLREKFRQPEQHQCCPPIARNASITASMRALREPFTSTVPPCSRTSFTACAATVASATCCARAPNPCAAGAAAATTTR